MIYHVPIIRNTSVWTNSPCYDPGTMAAVAMTVAGAQAGYQAYTGKKQVKAAQNAADDQMQRARAKAQALKDEQSTASSQAAALAAQKRRKMASGSRTVYTNPLGIGGMASTIRKTLLGQ